MDSHTLLWQYVHDRTDAAFEQIVRQHAGLVYSSAMRRTQTPTLAEEVPQQVFCHLARKAKDLPGDVILSGWLYRHTRFTAAKLMRGEARRTRREAKARQDDDGHIKRDRYRYRLE
ncbi:MAG: DNA-directed RNA polymerase specialized sigma24 family protein [Verrucomicrobiales bacterium]|jgi:DNA-directed RNA polymerase specialized sigma24 family protein